MTFHFFCPQGHLLEAEHEQAGQPAACPFCGIEMLIPAPLDRPSTVKPPEFGAIQAISGPDSPISSPQGLSGRMETEIPTETQSLTLAREENVPDGPLDQSAVSQIETGRPPGSESFQDILHIPCPLGHILETPPEMLGIAVMCPICQTTFEPQYEASQEYRQKREEMAAKAAERAARFWLQLAIGAAILVLGGLIMLIIFAPR